MSKLPPVFTPTTRVTPNQEDEPPQMEMKKRGRPKGTKMELLALQNGGTGGRLRATLRSQSGDSKWDLSSRPAGGKKINIEEYDSSSGYESDTTETSVDTLDDEFFDEEEDFSCLSDLDGNRILPIRKLTDIIQNKMCCRKCAIGYHEKLLSQFIQYTIEYENEIAAEERNIFFRSRTDRLEWRLDKKKTTSELFSRFSGKFNQSSTEDIICKSFHVSEETYGIATSIFGTCRRKKDPHHFRNEANRIK